MDKSAELKKRILTDEKFRQELITNLVKVLKKNGFEVPDHQVSVNIPTDIVRGKNQEELAWRVAVGPKWVATVLDF
jgi:hypothetical protein